MYIDGVGSVIPEIRRLVRIMRSHVVFPCTGQHALDLRSQWFLIEDSTLKRGGLALVTLRNPRRHQWTNWSTSYTTSIIHVHQPGPLPRTGLEVSHNLSSALDTGEFGFSTDPNRRVFPQRPCPRGSAQGELPPEWDVT